MSMFDTPLSQRLDEIKGRASKATEGPWNYVPDSVSKDFKRYTPNRVYADIVVHIPEDVSEGGELTLAQNVPAEDALFIAHAREDIPFLLKHIEDLTTRLSQVEADSKKNAESHAQYRREAESAMRDALSGYQYIREVHGKLYGVAFERVEGSINALLSEGVR